MTIKIGDRMPSGTLMQMTKDGPAPVSTDDLFKGKRVVLFAVPGAFTPTCSAKHVPSYVKYHDQLQAKKVDEIWCVAVNDGFVMAAWGRDQKVGGKVRMLGDGSAAWTQALGLELDLGARGLDQLAVLHPGGTRRLTSAAVQAAIDVTDERNPERETSFLDQHDLADADGQGGQGGAGGQGGMGGGDDAGRLSRSQRGDEADGARAARPGPDAEVSRAGVSPAGDEDAGGDGGGARPAPGGARGRPTPRAAPGRRRARRLAPRGHGAAMTELLALGASHKTAPLALRERIALTDNAAEPLLHELTAHPAIGEEIVLGAGAVREAAAAVPDALVDEVATTFSVSATLELGESTRAVVNDAGVAQRVMRSAATVVGVQNVIDFAPVAPSDDVSELLAQVPGFYVFLGGALADGTSGMHHSPDFAVADDSCRVLAGVLAASAVDLAQS